MFKRSSRLSSSKNELVINESVPVDDQFSGPKQCNYAASYPGGGKVLIANGVPTHLRDPLSLEFYTKFMYSTAAFYSIDADSLNLYAGTSGYVHKRPYDPLSASSIAILAVGNIRMIDFASDPTYGYVTSNNATDGHGVRMIRKSDMTVVAQLLATGSGNGQFNNPLGIKYYDGHLYVCDYSNGRIVKLDVVRTAGSESLTFDSNISIDGLSNPADLFFDGTNWFCCSFAAIYKLNAAFAVVSSAVHSGVYSICLIPDQSDGNGSTLCAVDNTNSHIERRKCSDLSLITTVGSSGTGIDSLCDPLVTGSAGLYITSEDQISASSGSVPTKNGFTGFFYANQPPHVFRFRLTDGKVLRDITAIDMSDDKITSIKNLRKCINITSLKLQTNVGLSLDLSVLSSKMVTLWAYGCGSGITGSIIHMTALNSVNLRENGASQDQVDQWINDLYANKDVLAAGTANFNGSNAAPSAPAKAKADKLVNDYAWSIAYTP